ncbi:MAG: putative glycoside hydrolase [Sporichthyaceae bacterium]
MTGTDATPPAPWGASGEPSTPAAGTGNSKRKTGRNVAIVTGVALVLGAVGAAASPLGAGSAVDLVANQDVGGAPLNAETVSDLAFTITGAKMSDVTLKLDGAEVTGTQEGDAIVFRPTGLTDGEHTISASKAGRLPGRNSTTSKTFVLDTTAPVITLNLPAEPVDAKAPFTLTGKAEGADKLQIDGADLEMAEDGTFSRAFDVAPRGSMVVATDAAGNVAEQAAVIPTLNSSGARSVHLTAFGWASSTLREPILQLLKDKKIDNIQLDIKDEDGIIGYQSEVPLAKAAGTGSDRYVAADALKQIHDLGGTVTGRIVAFRDPKLAKYAVANGKMDMVIQDASGNAYSAGNYGVASFTNFANQDVIDYNVGLAEEAAKLGFDQIMYDYIRKPENTGQVYPGIGDRTATEAIVDFVEIAGQRTKAAGATVGAAVYGISAFTPVSVAQDIPEMAKHLDFLSPMVYPSHWGPGEYSVAKPNSQPYDIVHRSMMEFNRLVLGTDCAIVPWLQDFTLGVSYGTAEVKAQIKAAADAGINGFYLWNASSKYTAAALEVMEPGDSQPGELVYSLVRPGVNPGEGTTDAAKAEEYIKAYLEAKKNGTTFVPPGTEAPATATETGTETDTETATESDTDTAPTDPVTPADPAATTAPEATSSTEPTTAPTP